MKPLTQLSLRMQEAKNQVIVGARYMHYKQKSYKVLALALREDTLEPCVVYQAEYGDKLTWIRTLKDWLQDVEVGGKKVNRFTRIEP